MADPRVNVRLVGVVIEPVAIDTGLWCNRCMLSSGVRVWITVRCADQMHLQAQLRCRDCGSGSHVEA